MQKEFRPLAINSVPAPLARFFLNGMHNDQAKRNKHLKAVKIKPEQLEAATGSIDSGAFIKVLHSVLKTNKKPILGLLAAEVMPHNVLGLYCHIVQTSHNVGHFIENTINYQRLLGEYHSFGLLRKPGSVLWTVNYLTRDERVKRQVAEFVLARWVIHIRYLNNNITNFPLEVHFQHAAPENPRHLIQYQKIFNCPIFFDQPVSALVLSDKSLNTPLNYSDPELFALLDLHAQKVLKRNSSENEFITEVRKTIFSMLVTGVPTRELVASQLGMSGRSLHRKLESLKSSYRDILDEVRLEFAKTRLKDSEQTVDTIAHNLGFSEGRTFSRWFKTISGATPNSFREHAKL